MMGGVAGCFGAAGRPPAKGTGNVVLEEMWDVRREGSARVIEEIGSRRRQGRQRQDGDGIGEAKKPICVGSQCYLSRFAGAAGRQTARNRSMLPNAIYVHSGPSLAVTKKGRHASRHSPSLRTRIGSEGVPHDPKRTPHPSAITWGKPSTGRDAVIQCRGKLAARTHRSLSVFQHAPVRPAGRTRGLSRLA
jgi:hypothetical protein